MAFILGLDGPRLADVYRRGSLDAMNAIIREQTSLEFLLGLPETTNSRQLLDRVNDGDLTLPKLYAAFLLVRPHRVSLIVDGFAEAIFSREFEVYVSSGLQLFQSDEEREQYIEHLVRLFDYLADRLATDRSVSFFGFAERFLRGFKAGTVYSCEGDLRRYAEAKARLIEQFVARSHGSEVSSWQPPSRRRPGPLRVGTLWYDTDRRTENIVGVASCRGLVQHGFDVSAIVLNQRFSVAVERSLEQDVRAISTRYVALFDGSLPATAQAIRDLDLDVLIIMNNITWGYSNHIALCSLRLARLQAVNFCAVYTTGFRSIDTYLSGAMSERAQQPDAAYSERLDVKPGSCLIFDAADYGAGAGVSPPEEILALRRYGTVFVSGANFYKLHPRLTRAWIEILSRVQDSVLILYPFNPNWDSTYAFSSLKRRLEGELGAAGVDPGRVVVAGPWQDASAIQGVLSISDIYLDSFPHSGGLSSLDALSTGIPVVTKTGPNQREGQTSDLLEILGLASLVAATEAEYVDLAISLSSDPDRWCSAVKTIKERLPDAAFFDWPAYSQAFAEQLSRLAQEIGTPDEGEESDISSRHSAEVIETT